MRKIDVNDIERVVWMHPNPSVCPHCNQDMTGFILEERYEHVFTCACIFCKSFNKHMIGGKAIIES